MYVFIHQPHFLYAATEELVYPRQITTVVECGTQEGEFAGAF